MPENFSYRPQFTASQCADDDALRIIADWCTFNGTALVTASPAPTAIIKTNGKTGSHLRMTAGFFQHKTTCRFCFKNLPERTHVKSTHRTAATLDGSSRAQIKNHRGMARKIKPPLQPETVIFANINHPAKRDNSRLINAF